MMLIYVKIDYINHSSHTFLDEINGNYDDWKMLFFEIQPNSVKFEKKKSN